VLLVLEVVEELARLVLEVVEGVRGRQVGQVTKVGVSDVGRQFVISGMWVWDRRAVLQKGMLLLVVMGMASVAPADHCFL